MKKKNPNPQGKGLVPVLQSLEQSRTRGTVPPKQINQISAELFTSLFILNSEFRFSPVPGNSYWLYRVDDKFKLFMLPPEDWSSEPPGQYIGECTFHEDVTWTLELSPEAAGDQEFLALVEQEQKRLETLFEDVDSIEDALPEYEESLPYYQRVIAYGLGSSLRTSMRLAGIHTLTYTQARKLLDNPETNK